MIPLLAFVPMFSGRQTPLDPAGPQARQIEHTLLLILWITSIVFVLVIGALAFGVLRNHAREGFLPPRLVEDPEVDRKARLVVGSALGLTVILLFIMMISSFRTSHETAVLANSQSLKINVYGHQWWWEVEYPINEQPYRMVRTANEIHVPVGTTITIHGTSRDVIHSFWAPNIHGKKDLLPGYENDLTLQVDKPGTWRGQCAEFCGLQHAHMAFDIVAQSREDFDRWYLHQLEPAAEPTTSPHRSWAGGLSLSPLCDVPYSAWNFSKCNRRTRSHPSRESLHDRRRNTQEYDRKSRRLGCERTKHQTGMQDAAESNAGF